MVLEEMNTLYNSWYMLQQPIHPVESLSASFRSLLAAVDQGWRLEEPVRVQYSSRSPHCAYHFVVTHPVNGQSFQLVVSSTPEVRRFIEQNNVQLLDDSGY